MAAHRCLRCGVLGQHDQAHLCKDIKARADRSAKAVALVNDALKAHGLDADDDLACDIVKALSGRDLGDN